MNRNKAIYALSDFALVVSASLAKGGTWEGAIENLRRSWVPLFVRSADPHSGNQRLIEKGGNAVDRTVLTHTVSLDSWLNGRDLASATPLPFDSPTQPVAAVVTDMIVPAPAESAPARPNPETVEPVLTADRDDPTDLFPIVWPHIKRALAAAHTEREVAELFQLEIKQTQIWLRRALDLGHVRKLNKPVRYVAEESSILALPLFDSHDED